MRQEDTPWWMQAIVGFEDEEETDDDDSDEDEDSEEEDEDDEEESEEDDEDDDEDEDGKGKKKPAKKSSENVEGLKSALRKERMDRKRLEREVRRLKSKNKPPEKPGDKPSETDDKPKEDTATKVNEKLAKRLRDQAVDARIISWATKSGFDDPDDAVRLLDRKDILVDQDEDDPTEIEVDDESVEDAVKALAKRKPRLLTSKDEQRNRSGSKFGGQSKGKNKGLSDEALKSKYTGLRR